MLKYLIVFNLFFLFLECSCSFASEADCVHSFTIAEDGAVEVASTISRSALVTPEFLLAMSRVSQARPLSLKIRVRKAVAADQMDEALSELKNRGADVWGSGFPLAGLPSQGYRVITLRTQEQASFLVAVMNQFAEVFVRAPI